jgi:hypothetical protein
MRYLALIYEEPMGDIEPTPEEMQAIEGLEDYYLLPRRDLTRRRAQVGH